jgi:hypothetical protein
LKRIESIAAPLAMRGPFAMHQGLGRVFRLDRSTKAALLGAHPTSPGSIGVERQECHIATIHRSGEERK